MGGVKLPRSVKVGPHTFKIRCDRKGMDKVCRSESSDLLGHTDTTHLSITIEPDQAPGQLRDTLLHELLHAICDTTGLAHSWEQSNEEDAIRRISPMLLDTLRSSPKLVEFLVAP